MTRPGEDVWIHSVCDMCFACCGILAHRQDGVLVKIEGDPGCPASEGHLCPKGQAGLIDLYDPSRVKAPLRRTNPEKGIGVDPNWQEITWDEALSLLVEKLKEVREEEPRKLLISSFDHIANSHFISGAWALAFGTTNTHWTGYYCGNYLHASMYLTNGSFHSDFDLDYCNYAILLGNQQGFMGGLNANVASRKMADARRRGMRVVVVDPVGTNAAAKADEWVPIRPGTDGAFILSLINVLVNELRCYDREFLSQRTNAAYLVVEDGSYLKEGRDGKPLVWDQRSDAAVPFDQLGIEPAFEGSFVTGGEKCRPAFQLLKEHVSRFTPTRAEEITTIPASTIRRIAKEFGEAARIGSTIVLDGKVLPYRPVAVNIYRGAMNQINIQDPTKFKLPYAVEILMVCRRNLLMNNVNPELTAEVLRKIPFIITFSTHLDEVAEFADLVLPEAHYLERLDLFPNMLTHTMSPATGHFYWGLRQPVVKPMGQARRWIDVLFEVADRMGFLRDVYKLLNVKWELQDPYKLEPDRRYSMEELYDRWAKSLLGPEHGIDWFKNNGYYKVPRSVEEKYPGPFIRPRFPVYFENMLRAKKAVGKIATQLGQKNWEISDYQALPEWKPCPAYGERAAPNDLFVVNFKIPFHSLSHTTQNPWLNDLAEHHPYAYKILINSETAARKGIKDGDEIWVESAAGKVKGGVKVTECIHPEVVGIAGVFGSWAKGKPVAKGRGVHFNTLLPISLDRIDPVSTGVDSCVRVKVSRAG